MQLIERPRKRWALLTCGVANRDHEQKVFVRQFINMLGALTGDADTHFAHYGDGHGIQSGGIGARAEGLSTVRGIVTKPAFGHLAAARIAGAEEENFAGHYRIVYITAMRRKQTISRSRSSAEL